MVDVIEQGRTTNNPEQDQGQFLNGQSSSELLNSTDAGTSSINVGGQFDPAHEGGDTSLVTTNLNPNNSSKVVGYKISNPAGVLKGSPLDRFARSLTDSNTSTTSTEMLEILKQARNHRKAA